MRSLRLLIITVVFCFGCASDPDTNNGTLSDAGSDAAKNDSGSSDSGTSDSSSDTGGKPDVGAPDGVLAFPSARGAGAYITGGRGGTVVPVTRLDDAVDADENPLEGTLRYALTRRLLGRLCSE